MNFEDFVKLCNHEFGYFPSKEEPPVENAMAEDLSPTGSWTDMGCERTNMKGTRELTLDPSSLEDSEDNRLSRSWECPRTPQYYECEEPHSADYLYSSPKPSPNKAKPDEPDSKDKIKSKLMSAWNNMRHVWAVKTKTNFKNDSTIFILGKEYPCSSEEREAQRLDIEQGRPPAPTSFDMFLDDFKSRVWLTYRRGFTVLPGSTLNSDVGWGCMIRSGQMMLAQALLVHNLQRNWRLEYAHAPQLVTYRNVVRMFGDTDADLCPFSLHKLIHIGEAMGKKPGDWYGPSSVAYVLRDAVETAQLHNQFQKDFCIYVAQDCTVYKQDVIDMCTYKEMPSRDNSSSSSNSPATSSKNTHPSPKSKPIVEHLDIRRPKDKSVFYHKLGIGESSTSQTNRSSYENVNIQSDHTDSSNPELNTVSAVRDDSAKHRTDSNDTSVLLASKQQAYQSDSRNERCSNGSAEQVTGHHTNENGSPRNPLYDYSQTANGSDTKSGMDRVTPLNLSEHLDRTALSDNVSQEASAHQNTAHAQRRFNPFDNHPLASGSQNHQSVTSGSPNNSSFLHHNYGMRPHRYDENWRPVLILIPVRLGGLEFNPVYEKCLKRILQSQYSVGIIGGKPKHSLFFIGWQDDKLLYLDPHFCQDHVDMTDPCFPIQTFQCESPRKLSFGKLDPSCTLGFYCRTQSDFNNFVTQSEKMASPANKARGVYPLYVFGDGRSTDVSYAQEEEERRLRLRRLDRHGRPKQRHRHPSKESNDDFVML